MRMTFLSLTTKLLLLFLFAGCVRTVRHPDRIRFMNAQNEFDWLVSEVDLPCRPLTLDDIIAIAIERNLDMYVKEFEYALQNETSIQAQFKLMPRADWDSEVSWRNRNTGSASESLVPNIPPAPPSISSEQNVHRYRITFTWNLIDYAVSFFRAREETNKTLMKQIEYTRVKQNLVLAVTQQYWKAVQAKKGMEEGQKLIQAIRILGEKFKRGAANRDISEIIALQSRFQLINMEVAFKEYQKDYHTSISQLALQMGFSPWVNFEIDIPDKLPDQLEISECCALEELALLNRPELAGLDVEEHVYIDEARAWFFQMFPQPILFGEPNFDGNRFLIFNNWLVAGTRAIWNIFSIPYYYEGGQMARIQQRVTRQKRLALTLGVMVQVHLSKLLVQDTLDQFLLLNNITDVKTRLLAATNKRFEYGEINEADRLFIEYEALIAKLNAWKAYSDLQIKLEELNNAIGIPRFIQHDEEGRIQIIFDDDEDEECDDI